MSGVLAALADKPIVPLREASFLLRLERLGYAFCEGGKIFVTREGVEMFFAEFELDPNFRDELARGGKGAIE